MLTNHSSPGAAGAAVQWARGGGQPRPGPGQLGGVAGPPGHTLVTWAQGVTTAAQSPLELKKVHPKVRNHGQGPYLGL